jgi:hypothetical protein
VSCKSRQHRSPQLVCPRIGAAGRQSRLGFDGARVLPGGDTNVMDFIDLPLGPAIGGNMLPLHPHNALAQLRVKPLAAARKVPRRSSSIWRTRSGTASRCSG